MNTICTISVNNISVPESVYSSQQFWGKYDAFSENVFSSPSTNFAVRINYLTCFGDELLGQRYCS